MLRKYFCMALFMMSSFLAFSAGEAAISVDGLVNPYGSSPSNGSVTYAGLTITQLSNTIPSSLTAYVGTQYNMEVCRAMYSVTNTNATAKGFQVKGQCQQTQATQLTNVTNGTQVWLSGDITSSVTNIAASAYNYWVGANSTSVSINPGASINFAYNVLVMGGNSNINIPVGSSMSLKYQMVIYINSMNLGTVADIPDTVVTSVAPSATLNNLKFELISSNIQNNYSVNFGKMTNVADTSSIKVTNMGASSQTFKVRPAIQDNNSQSLTDNYATASGVSIRGAFTGAQTFFPTNSLKDTWQYGAVNNTITLAPGANQTFSLDAYLINGVISLPVGQTTTFKFGLGVWDGTDTYLGTATDLIPDSTVLSTENTLTQNNIKVTLLSNGFPSQQQAVNGQYIMFDYGAKYGITNVGASAVVVKAQFGTTYNYNAPYGISTGGTIMISGDFGNIAGGIGGGFYAYVYTAIQPTGVTLNPGETKYLYAEFYSNISSCVPAIPAGNNMTQQFRLRLTNGTSGQAIGDYGLLPEMMWQVVAQNATPSVYIDQGWNTQTLNNSYMAFKFNADGTLTEFGNNSTINLSTQALAGKTCTVYVIPNGDFHGLKTLLVNTSGSYTYTAGFKAVDLTKKEPQLVGTFAGAANGNQTVYLNFPQLNPDGTSNKIDVTSYDTTSGTLNNMYFTDLVFKIVVP